MPPRLLLFLFRAGFSITVGRVLSIACFESRNLGHNFIGSEHALCALVRIPDSRISQLWAQQGIILETIRDGVVEVDELGPNRGSRRFRPMTPRLKRILPIAESNATRHAHLTIPQSLLLGILIEGQGVAVRVLKQLKCNVTQMRYDLETPKKTLQATAATPGR